MSTNNLIKNIQLQDGTIIPVGVDYDNISFPTETIKFQWNGYCWSTPNNLPENDDSLIEKALNYRTKFMAERDDKFDVEMLWEYLYGMPDYESTVTIMPLTPILTYPSMVGQYDPHAEMQLNFESSLYSVTKTNVGYGTYYRDARLNNIPLYTTLGEESTSIVPLYILLTEMELGRTVYMYESPSDFKKLLPNDAPDYQDATITFTDKLSLVPILDETEVTIGFRVQCPATVEYSFGGSGEEPYTNNYIFYCEFGVGESPESPYPGYDVEMPNPTWSFEKVN